LQIKNQKVPFSEKNLKETSIRFGILGCGYIGQKHAKNIAENADCEVVALCDVEENDWTKSQNIPFFSNKDDFFQQKNIDVICVCTPNSFHAEQAVQALLADKHVVIEKPMGLTKSDCEKVISTALNRKKQVFVVMQNRYALTAQWLKKTVDSGALGKIFLVEINAFWNRDERYYKGNWHGKKDLDGGTLFTQFSHFIDTIYWVFGNIKNISSRFFNFNHQELIEFEDSGIISFDLEKGGVGVFNYSTSVWDKNMESTLTIIAENGSLKISGQYMNELSFCHIKNVEIPIFEQIPSDNHRFIIQNVVDVLQEKNNIATNALEGMKVVEMIEQIYNCKNQK
jgi:UDP-N-acetyl-2-amino-2-deoxyglucuronate dehydrogenase